MIDGTIVRVHQQGTGARGGGTHRQAIGRSRGGLTTKIVALVDALGNLWKQKIDCDFHAYRWRYLVENFFCNLKTFRRIATRYEKTDQSYRAMINLAALKIAMR